MILHIRRRKTPTPWERMVEEEARRRHVETRVELEELEQSIIEHSAEAALFRSTSSGKRRRRRSILGVVKIAIRH
ncbi:hypothetical protein [Pyrodictium abyssi]|uniref:Uncharacterized protein n=1 Tax=Pyrodictium abyssi TaxID=54256 RepID=A0ABN6ZTX3_9CREN|nr:hypothetical protein PABY_18820 [Pyrodictium abyssi]